MNAAAFNPSKVTVNMDPVDILDEDSNPVSGERDVRDEWIVRTADGQVGPVAADLVVRGLNLGKVPESAEVARPGSDVWYPVSHIVVVDEPIEPATDEAPIVMAPVVPIGQPVFEWPDTFAPKAEAPAAVDPLGQTAHSATDQPSFPAPAAAWVGSMQPAPTQAASMQAAPMQAASMQAAPMQAASMQAASMQAAPMQAASMQATPMQQPGYPMSSSPSAEEPITIPTEGVSPAVIAFGATLGVSAFVAIGYAIIQYVL